MKTMYDSVDLAMIPPDAQAVAGYVGGKWPTYRQLAARFPHAQHFSIAVSAEQDAECLDVETGDATPGQVAAWVQRMERAGHWKPCIYANLSTMPAILQALLRANIDRDRVRLWVAHYTHTPTLPAGFDACQWTDRAQGRNLDESLVADHFFPTVVHSPLLDHAEQLAKAKEAQAQLPPELAVAKAKEAKEAQLIPNVTNTPRLPPVKRPSKTITLKAPPAPHPKVTGATAGGGLGVAIAAALHAFGVIHLTPAESAAIAALIASLSGYLTPSRRG